MFLFLLLLAKISFGRQAKNQCHYRLYRLQVARALTRFPKEQENMVKPSGRIIKISESCTSSYGLKYKRSFSAKEHLDKRCNFWPY